MKVQIQSPQIKVNERQEEFILHKLERLDRLYDHIEGCHVVFKKDKSDIKNSILIEMTLAIPGNDLFASAGSDSFEMAVDKVCSSLEGQLKKRKGKLKDQEKTIKRVHEEEDF